MTDRDLNFLVFLTGAVFLAETVTFLLGDLLLVVILAASADLVLRRIENGRLRRAEILRARRRDGK